MSVTAKLADGRTLEFPDGTDPSVVQSTVKRLLGQNGTPEEQSKYTSDYAKMTAQNNADKTVHSDVPTMADTQKKTPPEPPESFGEKALGMGQAAMRTAVGVPMGYASGIADMFHADKTRDFIDRQLQNATPLNRSGERYMGNVNDFLNDSKLQGLVPEMAAVPRLASEAKMAVPAIPSQVSRGADAARSASSAAMRAPGAVADAARSAVNDVRGTAIPPAKAAAASSARGALEEGATAQDAIAQTEAAKAQTLEAIRKRLDDHLSQQPDVPNLDAQGNTLGSAMKASYEAAKKARSAAADSEFATVRAAAQAKESTGARVDTSGIEAELAKMKEDASGIPDLEAGINRMMSATGVRPAKSIPSVPPPTIAGKYKAALPPPEPVATDVGKTFSQLELTRRYLNDIGYSGNLEGYPAIIRNRARDIANQLDVKMQEFVPEFAQYKNNYAANSEALHSMDTRFGRAVTSAEGGLKGDAYAKVAPQDLPGRLFAKKEGIDLVVDALAGGKNASPEARVAAQKQVNRMVEDWILGNTGSMSGEKAAAHINAPQMSATLSGLPQVKSKLQSRFDSRAALESNSKKLASDAKNAQSRSAAAAQASDKMKSDIEMADTLEKLPDSVSQQRALDGYMNALARERNAGMIDPEKYKATMELLSRANTLEERTKLARKIVGRIAGLGTALFVGTEVIK